MRSAPPRAQPARADREVLVVEPGFKWDAFLGANANASLFGDRKCVDLRIPSGKPGVEGAQGARRLRGESESRQRDARLAAARRSRDAVVGLVLGARRARRHDCRVSRRARRAAGMDRGAARAPEAARVARDARVPRRGLRRQPARGAAGDREARAAAAGGRARPRRRRAARSPTSRASTSSSSPKRGSPATPRARVRILRALQAEGDAPTLPIWQLSEDVHALAAVPAMVRSGTPLRRRCATRACGASGRRR